MNYVFLYKETSYQDDSYSLLQGTVKVTKLNAVLPPNQYALVRLPTAGARASNLKLPELMSRNDAHI
jgi:hypothetical protein